MPSPVASPPSAVVTGPSEPASVAPPSALSAGRRRRGTEVLWTVIPVVVVLFLAARSWVAVLDVERPAIASAVVTSASPHR